MDELDGEFWPCCIVSVANGPDEGFFWWEYGRRVVPEEVLACAWEVEDDIYGFIVWWLSVGRYSLWVEGEFPKACEVAPVSFQDGGLAGCDCGGVIIIDCCSLFENTVVYPASASFGTLTSVECSPGTMFISLAAGRSLCFRCIFFVALFVRLSGNMNVFFDGLPVSSKASSFSSGAALDVAPVSRIPIFCSLLLLTFRAQCAGTLLTGLVAVVAVIALSTLIVESISSVSSCSLT